MKAITELGFTKPSPIQCKALPLLLEGPTDFLGLAATGTGKTAAFAIPMLERLDASKKGVQALILCPTRELAIQVAGQVNLLGKYKGVRALPIYGGAGYGDQIYGLKRGASVVVGTPGRVVDHMEKGTLTLDGLETLILDEADEMISMGFKDDLEAVLGSVPEGAANTWLFSATMSPEVRRVADTYLKSPKQVQINRVEMLPDTIEQLYYFTQENAKPEVLTKLIDAADDFYGLIFCQTKALVMDLNQYLLERGYRTDCLHGDMDQNARERTMKSFRERKINLLICTDVASRGLDVKDITHVINYSIPRELDSYVHRIGRTARSGKSGVAMSLVTGSHRVLIPRIERMTKSKMKEGRIPTRKEIAAKKVSRSLSAFRDLAAYERAVELLDNQWKDCLSEMSREEIAGRFLALMHTDLFAERQPIVDPNRIVVKPLAQPAAAAPAPKAKSASRPVVEEAPIGEVASAPAPMISLPEGLEDEEEESATAPAPKASSPWKAKADAASEQPARKFSKKGKFEGDRPHKPEGKFGGKPVGMWKEKSYSGDKPGWKSRNDFKSDFQGGKPAWKSKKQFGGGKSSFTPKWKNRDPEGLRHTGPSGGGFGKKPSRDHKQKEFGWNQPLSRSSR